MAKLIDYDLSEDVEISNFKDAVRNLINFGKYAMQVVTALPSWAAEPGEAVLFRPSSGGTTMYFYAGSAWISSWSVTS